MTKLGFERRGTSWDFVTTLNGETVLAVGIQILFHRKNGLGLFPRVGFTNLKVENFWQEHLIGNHPRLVPTLTASLGYLCPDPLQLEWYCGYSEDDMDLAVHLVVGKVEKFGMPFMTRYPDLESLRVWAENPQVEPHGHTFQPDVQRAIVLYLLSDRAEAAVIVATSRQRSLSAGDPIDDPGLQPILRLKSFLDRQVAH